MANTIYSLTVSCRYWKKTEVELVGEYQTEQAAQLSQRLCCSAMWHNIT